MRWRWEGDVTTRGDVATRVECTDCNILLRFEEILAMVMHLITIYTRVHRRAA